MLNECTVDLGTLQRSGVVPGNSGAVRCAQVRYGVVIRQTDSLDHNPKPIPKLETDPNPDLASNETFTFHSIIPVYYNNVMIMECMMLYTRYGQPCV